MDEQQQRTRAARGEEQKVNPLCEQISESVRRAREHRWKDYYRSIEKNRRYAAGRVGDDDSEERLVRANMAYATMHGLIQYVYARNPEPAISPSEAVPPTMYRAVRQFAHTAKLVCQRHLDDGHLKPAAKLSVLSALTSRIGWAKVTYQEEYGRDPHIHMRIADAQDNLARLERLIEEASEAGSSEHEAKRAELEQLVSRLEEQVEVLVAEGLVVDVVRAEDVTLDPALRYLYQHPRARWIDERIWLPKEEAEAVFARALDYATVYDEIPSAGDEPESKVGRRGQQSAQGPRDPMVAVHETWHRTTSTVYTWVEGERDFAREPYSPEALGEKWDPYFPLSFYPLDGETLPMSLIDQLRELSDEYNATRTQLAEHREISVPHWITDRGTDRKSVESYRDAKLGEVVLVDANGQPLNQVFQAATPPPFNPAIYDTSQIRFDFAYLSGLQDAERTGVSQADTATEARIMQAGLSSRIEEMRDAVEDWMAKIVTYSLQILLQKLTLPQVQRIAGPHAVWPTMSQAEVFDLVSISIRAGSTGRVDDVEERENWLKLLPLIQDLQRGILESATMGIDPSPTVRLLEETLHRFDERLDVEEFLPAGIPRPGMTPPGQQLMGMGGQPGGQQNVIPFPGQGQGQGPAPGGGAPPEPAAPPAQAAPPNATR